MKKTWKRLCTGFLALATVVTALPTTPVHAESKQYWTESKERVGIVEKVMNDGSIGSTFNEGHLTVQSLSDSTKYKYRYLTLRRLGINDKSLFKTIRKQLLILFCVPAISAILCSFVMMSSLNNVYQQILGDKHLYLMYFGLNLIIFFLIYSIYWIATYIGFKRNINEAS